MGIVKHIFGVTILSLAVMVASSGAADFPDITPEQKAFPAKVRR